ncbi:cytochrome c oxidase subunit 7C, mitochondrial-like [Anticarsia gemmatalis]|uniref:cytochrome c oxidase subunit 7C, mitochondrial-like n=1 Tax=Anticarsia gemmatalis TaxID=129554 RepID=UPI003F766AAF
MLGPVARISNQFGRNYMKNFVRNGSHGGIPGENLPFDIHNRTRLTFNVFWFVGSGLAAPFILLAFQMKKK